MSQETYDTRVQCPGGQFKGGSCDTMTTFVITTMYPYTNPTLTVTNRPKLRVESLEGTDLQSGITPLVASPRTQGLLLYAKIITI